VFGFVVVFQMHPCPPEKNLPEIILAVIDPLSESTRMCLFFVSLFACCFSFVAGFGVFLC